MNIVDFLKNSANKYPQKIALISENDSFTFSELWKLVKDFSLPVELLKQQNVISLISENSSSFVIAYLKNGFPSFQMTWSFRHRSILSLQEDNSCSLLEYKFLNNASKEISI